MGQRLVASLHIGAVISALMCPVTARGQVIDLRTASLPRWTLEENLRIGSVDGPYDAFVSPVLSEGVSNSLLILDTGIPALRVFSFEGRFIRQFGTRGEGPGEYLAPGPFGVQGDVVWLSDIRTRRLTFYQQDGTVLESRVFGDPKLDARAPLQLLPGGDFLAISPVGPPSAFMPNAEGLVRSVVKENGLVRFRQHLLRVDRHGAVLDSILSFDVTAPVVHTVTGGVYSAPYLISDEPIVAFVPGSDLIREIRRRSPIRGQPAEFTVVLRRRNGSLVTERVFRDQSRGLVSSVRDSLDNVITTRFRRAPDAIPLMREYLKLPEFMPPVSAAAEAADGTLWMRRESFQRNGIEYLILDAELNPLAILQLPITARGMAGPISGVAKDLWLIDIGNFDVPYLVRYTIRK